jgi:hypothetical protein
VPASRRRVSRRDVPRSSRRRGSRRRVLRVSRKRRSRRRVLRVSRKRRNRRRVLHVSRKRGSRRDVLRASRLDNHGTQQEKEEHGADRHRTSGEHALHFNTIAQRTRPAPRPISDPRTHLWIRERAAAFCLRTGHPAPESSSGDMGAPYLALSPPMGLDFEM